MARLISHQSLFSLNDSVKYGQGIHPIPGYISETIQDTIGVTVNPLVSKVS